ncbi:rhomboid family membrane protein [Cordyceps fumosorosea ARSEF 2679]|uniref:Rhomboid-type serine protease n=1 Tax=Cordyceps fumosorosea (strain ARSEF 2679) TaxID=1081104 RepID=A0A167YAQ9_CORFA|nr:rhomboid family membrane protein [Cordyceps fumosorosea ARSEF 2679]OAA66077.1 rhomboid family membrane protein [Cordyceps fumosorosea ARSEF 2679]
MASGGNHYYASGGAGNAQQPPYYDPDALHVHSQSSTPAPQYHATGQPGYDYGYNAQHTQNQPGRPSPFDTVFDDHAYPPSSGQNSVPGGNTPQPGLYQDTGYYGQAGASPMSSRPNVAENIPLQDRPTKDGEPTDHIYDASAAPGQQSRRGRGKVRVGELGMLGSDKKRIPFVVYLFSLIQAAVFIAEIVKNGIMTGSPIMIKPQFNPMIGPSTSVLIYMGARYAPCMHNIEAIQGAPADKLIPFLCPNATTNTEICPLSTVCGFGGVPDPVGGNANQQPAPDQWFRFIIPIFMHAGVIHIGFNLLLQLTIAKEMEQAIGPIRFLLVYMSAGIFGFVMGGNFAAPGIASTGASGSLFGIIALTLLDLLYSWSERRSPVKDLMFIIVDMVISFVLGLLPGLDNFSHIGGFLMGLALGICVLHSPNALRRRMDEGTAYSAVQGGQAVHPAFIKSPVGFFKGRKPLWWAWWLVRVGVLITIIVVFIVLLNNFYKLGEQCSWCKYLSCLPIKDWCELGAIKSS